MSGDIQTLSPAVPASRRVRALRGATTVASDDAGLIQSATKELLVALVDVNKLSRDDIISVFFTMTADLTASYPACAARELGWDLVPLLCVAELDITGALPRCIRVLVHAETPLSQRELTPLYLRDAAGLRPDLSPQSPPGREGSPPAPSSTPRTRT
jgi:chorismate mutase